MADPDIQPRGGSTLPEGEDPGAGAAGSSRARLEASCLEREVELAQGEGDSAGIARATALLIALAELRDTQLGDTEGAISALEEARRATPDSSTVLGALRRLALKLWRWPLAADVLAAEWRLHTGAERTNRLLELAEVLDERLGRGDEALVHLCEVLDGDPAEPRALGRAIPLWTARSAWSDLIGSLEAAAESISASSPGRAAAYLYRAGEACRWRLQSPEKAALLFERAIELDATSGAAAKALAEVASESRDWRRLARALEAESSLAASPEYAAAILVKLGSLREDLLDDTPGAESAFSAALERAPKNRAALAALRRMAEAKGDHAAHAELLERSLLLATDVTEAVAISLALGTLYEESLGSKDRAANHFQRVLAVTADEAPAFRALGRLQASTGDWSGLVFLYEREARETPDPLHRTHCLFKIAELQEEKLGDDAAAIAAYRRVLEASPTYLPALRALGRLFQRSEDWAALVDLYRREAEATEDPSHSVGLLARVAELQEEKIGDLEAAVASWQSVLEVSKRPDTSAAVVGKPDAILPALRALGRLHSRRGAWEELVEVNMREASATADPRAVAALLQRTGEVYEERLDRPEDALRCYRDALDQVPSYLPAMRSLGRLAAQLGRWDEVIRTEELEADGTSDPRRAASMLASAAEHYETRLGAADRAMDAYERVLSRVPTYLPALSGLGRLYRKAGRWEDLVRILEATVPPMDRDPGAAAALQVQIAAIEGHRLGKDAESAARLSGARNGAKSDLTVRREQEEYLARGGAWTDLASSYATTAEEEGEGNAGLGAGLYVRLGDLIRRLGESGPADGAASAAGFYRAALAAQPGERSAATGLDLVGRNSEDEHVRIEALNAVAAVAESSGERRSTLVELAQMYERTGDFARAESCWAEVVGLAADSGSWEALATTRRRAGRLVEAAEALEGAIGCAPDELDRLRLSLIAAGVLEAAGEFERAETLLAPRSPSGGVAVLLTLERVISRRMEVHTGDAALSGRLVEIRTRLAEEMRDPRRRTETRLQIASSLAGEPGGGAQARGMLESIAGAEPAGSPARLDALARLAEIHAAEGDIKSQASALERLAEGTAGERRATVLLQAGTVLRELDPDRAILCWERAVATDLTAAGPALGGLIELYRSRESWQPLLATLNRVIQVTKDPRVAAESFYEKGLVLLEKLGLHDKAEAHFERALSADPDFVPALDRMVEIHEEAGRIDQARKAMRKLIALEPEDAPVTLERLVRAAKLDRVAGDDSQALERLHAVMARAPARTDVNEEILSILEARSGGSSDELTAALRNAALSAEEPRRTELRRRLAVALEERANDEAGAVGEYRAILRTNPEDVDARAALARIFSRKREDRPEAMAAHSALLKVEPVRVESLRWLAAVSEESGQHDKVLCLVGLLHHLGAASDEQKVFYEDQIAKAPRPGAKGTSLRPVSPEDRRALLVHPDARSNTGDLFGRLGPYLWAGTKADPGTSRAAPAPLKLRLDAIRALFGVSGRVDLLIGKKAGADVVIAPGNPHVLVAGEGVPGMPVHVQDFLLARAVFRLAAGWGPGGRSAAEVRSDLWLAAAALDLTEAPKGTGSRRLRAVGRAIPRRMRKELAEPLGIFVSRPASFDVELFVRGAERSADRAGVLASVDVASVVRALGGSRSEAEPSDEWGVRRKAERPTKGGSSAEMSPALREALVFASSEDLFMLRRRTGLTIFAG